MTQTSADAKTLKDALDVATARIKVLERALDDLIDSCGSMDEKQEEVWHKACEVLQGISYD